MEKIQVTELIKKSFKDPDDDVDFPVQKSTNQIG